MKLEEEAGKLLAEKSLTVACAESCTGGLLTSRLTDVAGSSRYVRGSVVAYSSATKNKLLGVKAETLEKFGAISEETAVEMALGAKKTIAADIGIGITGNAGPSGDEGKKVGLVYISVADKNGATAKRYEFRGARDEIKRAACDAALVMLRDRVKQIHCEEETK